MMFKRNRQRGFTLIELLIVIAIIGIIAAILIPNLIDALQKAKQKRTLSEMRNVGTSWMSWLTDQITASAAGGRPYDLSQLTTLDYRVLAEYMNSDGDPTFFYMQDVPENDGWGHPYIWARNANLLSGNVMAICSSGRDTSHETDGDCQGNMGSALTGAFIATNYDHDIVWADGFMVVFPGGVGGATP
jgi:prepilin-type N-terminal cleavage/methylation domain-containing protein